MPAFWPPPVPGCGCGEPQRPTEACFQGKKPRKAGLQEEKRFRQFILRELILKNPPRMSPAAPDDDGGIGRFASPVCPGALAEKGLLRGARGKLRPAVSTRSSGNGTADIEGCGVEEPGHFRIAPPAAYLFRD